MEESEAREIVRELHCGMCGTQRCDSSDEYMEGCGYYNKLMGIVTDSDKILAYYQEQFDGQKKLDIDVLADLIASIDNHANDREYDLERDRDKMRRDTLQRCIERLQND